MFHCAVMLTTGNGAPGGNGGVGGVGTVAPLPGRKRGRRVVNG